MKNDIIFSINLLNEYKHFPFPLVALKEGILKIPGNKYNPNGYNKDNKNETNVSFIK